MDKAAEERKKKIRNLEYSLFSGGKSNNVSYYEILMRNLKNENCDITIAMSSSCADPAVHRQV